MKVLCIFLFFSFALSSARADTLKRVLMIHSYPKGIWHNGLINGASKVFDSVSSKYKLDNILYDYEKLRFQGVKKQNQRISEILKYIEETDPEYIIINDDEAIKKLSKKIPKSKTVLLNGLNQSPKENKEYVSYQNINNQCGVVEYYPIEQSLEMISLMGTKINQMSIISSDGESSKIVTQIFNKLKHKPYKNFKIRKIINEKYWKNWKKELRDFEKKDDLVWILVPFEVFKNEKEYIALDEMAKWIRSNVKKPLLGILSVHTKMGFLSAISVTPEGLGRQIAEMVLKLEKGKVCKEIGFEKSKYHNFEINISEIKRLKLKMPTEFIGVASFLNDDEIFK